jgi:RNase adaptor protein for sRNA GlmZ degradation
MASVISSILVGILKMIGWQALVVQVLEDIFYYISRNVSNELAKDILQRLGDSMKAVEKKE